jgi:hypothetical protein
MSNKNKTTTAYQLHRSLPRLSNVSRFLSVLLRISFRLVVRKARKAGTADTAEEVEAAFLEGKEGKASQETVVVVELVSAVVHYRHQSRSFPY